MYKRQLSAWVKSSQSDITDEEHVFYEAAVITLRKQAATEKFIYNLLNSSGTVSGWAVSSVYADTDWHHIVATYNGTHIALYIDGNLDSIPQPLSGDVASSSTYNFVISGQGGFTPSWNGSIAVSYTHLTLPTTPYV